jgi:hypothetical protein
MRTIKDGKWVDVVPKDAPKPADKQADKPADKKD